MLSRAELAARAAWRSLSLLTSARYWWDAQVRCAKGHIVNDQPNISTRMYHDTVDVDCVCVVPRHTAMFNVHYM